MKGKYVQRHPDITTINEMFGNGYTSEEISKWLKQKHKHIKWHLSAVTLQAYKNNFLQMTLKEAKEKRKELLATGKTGDANAVATYTATKEFTEAKEKVTKELVNTLGNFKDIQEKILERINLVEEQTKDKDGNAVYKPRNEEILQGYLQRLESMTNSFAKAQADMKKQELISGGQGTNISITMSDVHKYAEAFKEIVQEILTRLEPALINDFLAMYTEKTKKITGEEEESKVNISIDGNNSNKVNITTGKAAMEPESPSEEIPTQESEITKVIDVQTDME